MHDGLDCAVRVEKAAFAFPLAVLVGGDDFGGAVGVAFHHEVVKFASGVGAVRAAHASGAGIGAKLAAFCTGGAVVGRRWRRWPVHRCGLNVGIVVEPLVRRVCLYFRGIDAVCAEKAALSRSFRGIAGKGGGAAGEGKHECQDCGLFGHGGLVFGGGFTYTWSAQVYVNGDGMDTGVCQLGRVGNSL